MAWLADAHNEWHTVNGRYEVCPLDCGVTEGLYDEYDTVDLEPPTEEQLWTDPWRDWAATEPF